MNFQEIANARQFCRSCDRGRFVDREKNPGAWKSRSRRTDSDSFPKSGGTKEINTKREEKP